MGARQLHYCSGVTVKAKEINNLEARERGPYSVMNATKEKVGSILKYRGMACVDESCLEGSRRKGLRNGPRGIIRSDVQRTSVGFPRVAM